MSTSQVKRFLDSTKIYTNTYERNHMIRDWDSKERVAKKILRDFEKRVGGLEGKSLLDVGFGNGVFSIAFAGAGASVSGIEVDSMLLEIAKENINKAGVKVDLQIYDGTRFPFKDEIFDYIYSTSVLEHVTDASFFLKEINRVLKPKGFVYLTFPNRMAPQEAHTGLWFLSYLPRYMAEWYLRKIKKRNTMAELNLHFLSYFDLLKYLKKTQLAVKFEIESSSLARRILKKFLARLHLHQSVLLKTISVILEKK